MHDSDLMSASVVDDYKSDQDWWWMWWSGTLFLLEFAWAMPNKAKNKRWKCLEWEVPTSLHKWQQKIPVLISLILNIITNSFIISMCSGKWSSVFISTLCVLQKCLVVKFKQHKCLSTKQSSSECFGTRRSFFGGEGGGDYIQESCWAKSFIFFFSCDSAFVQRGEFPWKSHIFMENSKVLNSTGDKRKYCKLAASISERPCLSFGSRPLVPVSVSKSRL